MSQQSRQVEEQRQSLAEREAGEQRQSLAEREAGCIRAIDELVRRAGGRTYGPFPLVREIRVVRS